MKSFDLQGSNLFDYKLAHPIIFFCQINKSICPVINNKNNNKVITGKLN